MAPLGGDLQDVVGELVAWRGVGEGRTLMDGATVRDTVIGVIVA